MTALQLKEWRLSQKLSQSQLAKLWGISVHNIRNWEQSRCKKIPTLAELLIKNSNKI